jgi:hypothetical protein
MSSHVLSHKEPSMTVTPQQLYDEIRDNLSQKIPNNAVEQFIRAEFEYENIIAKQKEEKATDPKLRVSLNKIISIYLISIGVNKDKIDQFLAVERSISTLKKITTWNEVENRYEGLPTLEELELYSKLPKNLSSLGKIKHPLLYNWSQEELIEALSPYIGDNAKKYSSNRCTLSECKQEGAFGVMMAVRTDAGIAPFANHAYSRIRTSIRRPAAESGVVSVPEKRPSETEVKRATTAFLAGRARQYELDRLAMSSGFIDYEAAEKKDEIKKKSDKIFKGIVTPENLLAAEDITEQRVQRTGVKNATELLVCGGIKLSRFSEDVRRNLIRYLNRKFFGAANRGIDPSRLDPDKVQCLSDIVKLYATIPNFRGGHVGAAVDEDGTDLNEAVTYEDKSRSIGRVAGPSTKGTHISCPFRNPEEIVGELDYDKVVGVLVDMIYNKINLSDKQRVVGDNLFGMNGVEPMRGSEIAANFGSLSHGKDTISRQRVAQYQDAIVRKFTDQLFEEFESDPNFYKLLNSARKLGDLTMEEDAVLVYLYGLKHQNSLSREVGFHEKIHDVSGIVLRYEIITKSKVPYDSEREKYILGRIHDVKLKVLRALLF